MVTNTRSRGTVALTIVSILGLICCLGVGTVWLSGQVERALTVEAETILARHSIAADVEAHGRDLVIKASTPADEAAAIGLLKDLPGASMVAASQGTSPTSPTKAPSATGAAAEPSTSPSPLAASPSPTPSQPASPDPTESAHNRDVAAIAFEGASADLDPRSESSLSLTAEILTADPSLSVTLTGHTDNGKTQAERLSLGYERAAAVSKALQERGIDKDRITEASQGSRDPIAENSTQAGRAANRRVTIVIQETN